MNKMFSLKKIFIIAGLILLIPKGVFASQLNFKLISANSLNDKTTVVEVYLDPESKNINTVEGIISIKGSVSDVMSFVTTETGGSVLTFWPVLPEYSADEKVIRFVGGVPNGFTKEGMLFRIRLSSRESQNVTLSWIGGFAFLNDGKGTKDNVSAKSINIAVNQQEKDKVKAHSPDTTPPYFNVIEKGKDPNTYDGKHFINVQALDDISGVEKYEIEEDGEITTKYDYGIYIYKDQTRRTSITITAYDKAGNSVVIKIPGKNRLLAGMALIIFSIILLAFALRKIYKKINN